MAKYTIEVRTILYQAYLDANPEATIDQVLKINPRTLCKGFWNKIFHFEFPMFQGMTKEDLCSQILMHYYMREIALETVPLWQQCLDTRMNAIMPYYVKLANSEITKAEALQNRNITETTTRTGDDKEKTVNNQSVEQVTTTLQDSTNTENRTDDNYTLVSDTPQDGLQAVKNGTYLSNATNDKVDSTIGTTYSGKNDVTNTGTNDQTGSRDKNYSENVSRETSGFDGDIVDTIKGYREILLNIPAMIINDLADLFITILV